jgi:hypothetical protein
MVRLALLGVLLLGGAGGLAWWEAERPPQTDSARLENSPDTAAFRWRTSQPRHWRHVVISQR